MLPAEISVLGAPQGASSVEEDPFPESLKEERFSDQSSLLREMDDATAALSKQLKPQAPGAPPAPANTAHHPQDDAEPQMGLEEATAHGTTPRMKRETLSGHIGHKLFEGDMEEGPGTTPDVPQAGASTGAGHHGAQEPEQGEKEQRMLFPQGKGGGVKEAMLKVAEHLQGALGENTEAGEQLQMEVEGAGWMQEKRNWEKAQVLGEAEEVALSQGENLEAGLGSPGAEEAGLVVRQCLGMDELHPAAAQALRTGLGEEAQPPLGLSKELEMKPGELLEPEPPPQGEARIGAAQGDSVVPKVTAAPGPGMLEEDPVSAEAKLQGETSGAEVLPAQAPHGAGTEEREVQVAQGESARGDAEQGGSVGAEVPVPVVLEGGAGTDVPPLEAQSSRANVQLLAEVEAALQPWVEAGSLGTKQGGSMAPDVQPLEEDDQPELGLGENMGAGVVHGEGPSPAEMSLGSPDLCGLSPVKAQALETVEAKDSWADTQRYRNSSPETPQGEEGHTMIHLLEEDEDGAQEQNEHGLPQEPVLDLQGAGCGQGEGPAAGMQPQEDAESLDRLEDQNTGANVQALAVVEKPKVTPGGSTEAGLQLLSEVSSLDTEQGGSVAPDVQPLDQVDKAKLVEMEVEDSRANVELHGGPRIETLHGGEHHAALQLVEEDEDEDGEEGQSECGLPHEPVLHPSGVAIRQQEGAAAAVLPWEEAESLGSLEDQSTDASVQMLGDMDEVKVTPGGSTEADLQLWSEVSSLGTEQGGSVSPDVPDVQTLHQVDKAELVEMKAEDWADMELHGGHSPETPQGGGDHAAMQLVEEDENGEEGQGEHGLQQESVLDLQGAGFGQGEGAAALVQAQDKAVILHGLEVQSTDTSVQPLTGPEELRSSSGGSPEANVGAAGMREGEQSHTPGSDVAHTAERCREAAGAHVSPSAEAISYPECATAPKAPGVEAKQGALTGPDGQILEDTQTLELPQGERAAAEGRPLDGAQGLEVGQGERLEAGVRSSVETQALGVKQGHDDGAPAPAFPVSEVPLQISTLKLEAMMQEDVLVPDVRPLGASGQAARSELQEQVSAQAEKPPHTMETEKEAPGPAEVPKEEVPPASPLHTTVLQEEDAGNDQLGMVFGGSSLGDAGSIQPQRQCLGEQSKDLDVNRWKKKQEVKRKMSQEGEPSPGEPGNVAADGAGSAPRGSPKAPLDPDHLYNVLFVGDSHVGKTSFLYRLQANTFNPHLTATVGLDYQVKSFVVDNKCFALRLWDSAGQERYHSITKQFFRKADGVVLMYDITSEYSFLDVQYWLSCIQEGAEDGVAILLLGNKTDCAAERQVPMEQGERLAKEHQLMFYECSAASGHNISESMVSLIRLLKVNEDKLKNKVEEVPKLPQKKKSCCW